MKTYTFSTNTTNKSNKPTFFNLFHKEPDYSKILDDIIADNIIKSNPYLKKAKENTLYDALIDEILPKNICSIGIGGLKDENTMFFDASKYLTKCKSLKNIILGKKYELNGTTIIFYDDEIQIGSNTYSYDYLTDIKYFNCIPTPTKKIIINIFINKGDTLNITF